MNGSLILAKKKWKSMGKLERKEKNQLGVVSFIDERGASCLNKVIL